MTTPTVPAPSGDAFSPREIAERVSRLGVAKANSDVASLLVLAILAGAFIALGALFFVVVISGSTLGFGPTRLLGGAAFSLGLVLVVVAGAELFTGNNLIVMAWASGLVSFSSLLRSWLIVYAGNLIGAVLTVLACWVAGAHLAGGGDVQKTLLAIAHHKASLSPMAMIASGMLCNALVCLAVWLTQAGHSVVDKVVGVIFPVTAFVAIGFEHSIANLFFLPFALLIEVQNQGSSDLWRGALMNIALVTVGNVVGGAGLVAGVYSLAYLRPAARPSGGPP